MDKWIFVRAFITWLLFIPVPVLNGILRENWYKQRVGEVWANAIGFVVLGAVFVLYVYVSFGKRLVDMGGFQLFALGALWLALTLVFEFGVGLAAGRSWEYMLADYNVLRGRLWSLILLAIFFSPHIVKFILKNEH